jgi:23S rRNA (cytosine1962-C5)-methyltransferase
MIESRGAAFQRPPSGGLDDGPGGLLARVAVDNVVRAGRVTAGESGRRRQRRGRRQDTGTEGRRLVERLERALAVRERLLADTRSNVCRVFNGAPDGIDGLVIEKFGDVLIVQLHKERLQLAEERVRELCEHARRRLGARAVYRKVFTRDRSGALPELSELHTDPRPWLGDPVEAELPVLENGLRFLVRPYDGYSVGLFLEHRENRQRVRALAAGCAVLNAFAYTCGFSVAAACGGAAATVSVDGSKKYLEWGKRNFAANGIPPGPHAFICSDIFDYYRRAKRQRRSFDLIVLDPPTFARMKRPKRVFVLAEDLDRLVAGATELLNPSGHLLLATNHRGTSRRRLEKAVATGVGRRPYEIVQWPRLPLDFRGDPDYAKAIVARID